MMTYKIETDVHGIYYAKANTAEEAIKKLKDKHGSNFIITKVQLINGIIVE